MSTENEYTPTTEEIREAWVIVDEPDTRSTPPLWIGAEFDRWLAAHDAEAAAKALEDFGREVTSNWFFANLHDHQRRQIDEVARRRAAALRASSGINR